MEEEILRRDVVGGIEDGEYRRLEVCDELAISHREHLDLIAHIHGADSQNTVLSDLPQMLNQYSLLTHPHQGEGGDTTYQSGKLHDLCLRRQYYRHRCTSVQWELRPGRSLCRSRTFEGSVAHASLCQRICGRRVSVRHVRRKPDNGVLTPTDMKSRRKRRYRSLSSVGDCCHLRLVPERHGPAMSV